MEQLREVVFVINIRASAKGTRKKIRGILQNAS